MTNHVISILSRYSTPSNVNGITISQIARTSGMIASTLQINPIEDMALIKFIPVIVAIFTWIYDVVGNGVTEVVHELQRSGNGFGRVARFLQALVRLDVKHSERDSCE